MTNHQIILRSICICMGSSMNMNMGMVDTKVKLNKECMMGIMNCKNSTDKSTMNHMVKDSNLSKTSKDKCMLFSSKRVQHQELLFCFFLDFKQLIQLKFQQF